MAFTKGFRQGREDKNPYWKGNKATSNSIHWWVRRNWGKAIKCMNCDTKNGLIEWSNIDHSYTRMKGKWQQLCRKCHIRYDIANGFRPHQKKKKKENTQAKVGKWPRRYNESNNSGKIQLDLPKVWRKFPK